MLRIFRSALFFLAAAAALPLFARPPLPEVVARVDGEPITRADLERTVDVFLISSGQKIAEVCDASYLSTARTVLNEMVNDRLILRAAKDVEVSERDVTMRFDELKRSYASPEEFREEMIKSGQTEQFLQDQLRTMIRQERWLAAQVQDKLGVTPAEIELAYKRNLATFTMPEQMRIAHILLQIDVGATPEQIKEKETLINQLAARVKAGEDFAALAKEYSEDSSSKNKGGVVGYVFQKDVDSAVGEAAFKLKDGEVSPVVRSKLGFHLLKCMGRAPAEPMPYDQVKDRVATLLRGEKRRAELQKLLASLRAKAKVEILLKG